VLYQIIMFFHVLAALCIVGLVLMQQGRGSQIGAAFGSGASQTVFGSRGSGSFLVRLVIGFMVVFFCTSLSLNYIVAKANKVEQIISLPVVPKAPTSVPVGPKDAPVPVTPNEIPTR
jgi:preprotein translocase subunit SecG